MHFNSKLHYGVRALAEIALASNGIFQKEIAEKQEISNKYLDHIISDLKTKGLIRHVKGPRSGYIINVEPSTISIYDIYTAFEPEIKIMDCLTSGYECIRMQTCSLHVFCHNLNFQIIGYFKSITLKDLIENNIALLPEMEYMKIKK